ncbi:2415_t:CDS:2 [Racocetra persica]|uniref:2415_t:CDS:1 n=1 Tax=Racocetra persica TaxID=160502 RepID=A0ACA9MK03_9GLOM|nr:2415_t:CDS:2 [Racocetra persica]
MNQPTNQAVRGQPLAPQNVNIPVNSPFHNLTAEQKYKILTNGTNPFTVQETENQASKRVSPFS